MIFLVFVAFAGNGAMRVNFFMFSHSLCRGVVLTRRMGDMLDVIGMASLADLADMLPGHGLVANDLRAFAGTFVEPLRGHMLDVYFGHRQVAVQIKAAVSQEQGHKGSDHRATSGGSAGFGGFHGGLSFRQWGGWGAAGRTNKSRCFDPRLKRRKTRRGGRLCLRF